MLNKAIIDLGALRNNALKVKNKLPKKVKLCAVVKADAYGHGAEAVSSALYTYVDYYAVALTEEGINLRLSGIDKPILVLIRCFKQDLKRAIESDLTLTACSLYDLIEINRESKRQNKCTNVHIKYNTGMNRQGVDGLSCLRRMLSYASKQKNIFIDGLYSHYAFPENDKLRKSATSEFLLAISLVKGYNNNAICHISASGGFLKGEYFDMVRIGILLYGYKPYKTDEISVSPIMKLYAPSIKIRKLKRNESALYGDKKATEETDISLIRYGYADGLDRIETEGQFNNRCMDVTAVKGSKKKVNILADIDKLCKNCKTIPYEILCKVAFRAEKIYKN